ncbi:YfhO family protein [Tenacibaculum finnmarkense genomovar ulcerans]|uniref:YfhO family protein n=1 Tax=Tenacibaculum finnmarkense TaxID=2781243 RepID=UPI00187B426E|nr:YfhO family protein [Tenacibaculum finnmarkense]MBE7632766.1 YfhO family protein [Tenacibaculum finnmarkense genomovar ulcerans]MCD8428607.1 YfhO family protein [Tenacibaculum finnmarkense genomovar ulcerans]
MNYKKWIPCAITLLVFAVISLLYFSPVLSGKQLKQGDITQFIGMSKQVKDYRLKKETEPYWLGNAFSGMPAYQVSAYYPNDFVRYIDKAIRFLPRPADYLFLYFFGFFILLTALKVDWKLAILGSLSFGFSTYLIIIFGAGHNAKAHAIGYMPVVIAGVLYVFRKKYLLGFVLTALAMALEVYTNHPQMTYYLGFCLLILGIVEFIDAIKTKNLSVFAKQAAILIAAMAIGLGVNSTRLLSMKQYGDFSTRGKSELTINPDGSPKEKSTGLDKSYITEYSYGIFETFNLIIPRFMGGGTVEELGENSEFYQTLEKNAGRSVAKEYSKQVLTYWGTQPIVEAPAYIGAILFFLFFLGIFLVKGRLKYWLVSATIFSIVLSWGKNFAGITNFFIDYMPLYNKFRAVSSIQVIAELCVPLLGIIALRDLFCSKIASEEKENALKNAFYVLGGITLLFALFGSSLFAFEGLRDAQYQQLPTLVDALISDRKAMLFNDSIRSFLLILASAVLLWFYLKGKLKQVPVILILGALIIFDLVSVDIKYVNKEDFKTARKVLKPFTATKTDTEILKDKSYYRVANFSVNPMQDGRTSYFHNSIGGYHAAKMKRYQELFDYQISKNNMEVLNMLNAKYFIVGDDKLQENTDANGNAWFVNNLKIVTSADEEILALDSLNTKTSAVINAKNYTKANQFKRDSTAIISLIKNDVTTLVYKTDTQENQFAVFSEIYYKGGWNAYLDDKLVPHYQVNYVLRGMEIPKGNHEIIFKYEPKIIETGNKITLFSYVLLLLIPMGWFFIRKKKNKK